MALQARHHPAASFVLDKPRWDLPSTGVSGVGIVEGVSHVEVVVVVSADHVKLVKRDRSETVIPALVERLMSVPRPLSRARRTSPLPLRSRGLIQRLR